MERDRSQLASEMWKEILVVKLYKETYSREVVVSIGAADEGVGVVAV